MGGTPKKYFPYKLSIAEYPHSRKPPHGHAAKKADSMSTLMPAANALEVMS